MRRNRFVFTGLKTAAAIGFMLLAQPGQATDNPLGLFKNYFVTGDAASVGLPIRGSGNSATNLSAVTDLDLRCADGDAAHFNCVPKSVDGVNTDIIAAFLYWEVIEKTAKPSGAKGMALDPGVGHAPPNPNPGQGGILSYSNLSFFGEPIGADHAAPCWSSGGSTGSSNGAPTLRTYRADFLRYLEVDPNTGQRIPFARVQLPDSGSKGAGVPLTEGASLVVVYRNYKLPFRGVVIYDGSFTMNNTTDSLNQTIYGFYEASEVTTDLKAKITHIVGDGQSNFPEILTLGPSASPSAPVGLGSTSQVNVFNGPNWDDQPFDITSLMAPGAYAFTTTVGHGSGSFDCLSWGAIILSTTVQDSDQDGLLDVWEKPAGFVDVATKQPINLTWKDNNGVLRGADPCVRNIFIEVDYMNLTDALGNVLHTHALRQDALDLVGNAFNNAGGSIPALPPVSQNPPICTKGIPPGIKAYFDVGNNYQGDPYVMPPIKLPDGRILAPEGGDIFNEKSAPTYCTLATAFPESCVFPNQPGVVSWKEGVHHIQKMHTPSGKRYFSDYRSNIFHWALMSHALAMEGPPLAPVAGFPQQYQANSTSGRADLPGGDFVVSVGLWRFTRPEDAYRGSKILQASTFLHELAHNLWGFHGGVELKRDSKRVTEGINCKPQQQSVLNYMYHAAGLLDRAGNATVDLSGEAIAAAISAEREAALDETLGVGTSTTDMTETKYRLRWYAPVSAVTKALNLPANAITGAKAHCDGTALLPADVPMVRADRLGLPADVLKKINVDWNYDGTISATALTSAFDINFDGYTDETSSNFTGVNDWQHIIDFHGLQQVGIRRSVFGLSVGVNRNDLLQPGQTMNSSEADVSEADVSEADVSEADVSEADVSEADVSEADVSEADVSEADVSEPDPNKVDIDANTAGGSAPSALTAVVDTKLKAIVLNWEPPTAGTAVQYTLYRQTVGSTAPPTAFVLTGTPPPAFQIDTTVKKGTYIYFVTAGFDEDGNPNTVESTSDQSNIVQITF